MASNLEVEQNEVEVVIKSGDGAELSYDKVNNTVTVNSSVDYATFIKMVKLLKRTKNRASFNTMDIDLED